MQQELEKQIKNQYYKSISFSNMLIQNVIKPQTSQMFRSAADLFGDDQSQKTEQQQQTINADPPSFTNQFQAFMRKGINAIHDLAIKPWDFLQQKVSSHQANLEQHLKDLGVNVQANVFSLENLQVLDQIGNVFIQSTQSIKHIGNLDVMKYLAQYVLLQKLCLLFDERLVYGSKETIKNQLKYEINNLSQPQICIKQMERHEKLFMMENNDEQRLQYLIKARNDCKYFCVYANAPYGAFYNKVLSGEQVSSILSFQDQNQELLEVLKCNDDDLLFSDWNNTPYHPAYCIMRDELEKNVVVSIRGSLSWVDAVTDCSVGVAVISIMEDLGTGQRFIRVENEQINNQNSQNTQNSAKCDAKIKPQMIKSTIGISPISDEEKESSRQNENNLEAQSKDNYKMILKGYAHSGVFYSALELFPQIQAQLLQIFKDKLDPNEYTNVVITGHSLGGGLTSMLALLFYLHPLQKCKEQKEQTKVRAFAYGAPPVLSKEFGLFFKKFHFFNVINETDCVPRLQFHSLMDINNWILAFHGITDLNLTTQILKTNFTNELSSLSQQQFEERQKLINMYVEQESLVIEHDDRLWHVGDVFLLSKIKTSIKKAVNIFGQGFSGEERQQLQYQISLPQSKTEKKQKKIRILNFRKIEDMNYFRKIIFSTEMIKFHMPHHYKLQLEQIYSIYQ